MTKQELDEQLAKHREERIEHKRISKKRIKKEEWELEAERVDREYRMTIHIAVWMIRTVIDVVIVTLLLIGLMR